MQDPHEEHPLREAMQAAFEVSKLYTDEVNPKANVEAAMGSIIAAMYCPDMIGLDRRYTKEELCAATRIYAYATKDFPMMYKYRNYNFFAKGKFEDFVKTPAPMPSQTPDSRINNHHIESHSGKHDQHTDGKNDIEPIGEEK
ncbi:MAG: hypothetical protein PHX79_05485 [Sphaerochaetaceae bacterium]|nr:hypothetical protein [Sphaerochaetaceae bacterium]